ncbi:MAG: ABC transporter permease [Gammaproteobacteria bacterium]
MTTATLIKPAAFKPGFSSQSLFVGCSVLFSCLLIIPLLVVLSSLFFSSGDIWQHLYETVLADYLLNSLLLMLGTSILVLPLGVLPAWLLTMYKLPMDRQLQWLLLLPMAMPAYIIAYTYTGMLDVAGPLQSLIRSGLGLEYGEYWFPEVRSLTGAIVMLSLVLYPYVYLLARAAFIEQSICVLEVAETLGCNALQAFCKVALPLARPAIFVGLSLVMMETLADYGTVQYFGVATFTTGIFRTWFGLGSSVAAAQLSAILMCFVFALILLENRSRRQARFHHTSNRYSSLQKGRLSPARRYPALLFCLLPVVFGFIVPALQLCVWAWQTYSQSIDKQFLLLAWHSIELALITSLAAGMLALLIAYSKRIQRNWLTRVAGRVAGLGYAIPGTVIAVGVLLPFIWLDKSLTAIARTLFASETEFYLAGTLLVLIFAYLVRFLPISLNTVDAGLAKIKPSMEEAGRTAGYNAFALLRHLHVPLMRGSILTAMLLVFVDVLKELPATLILRPFDFNTLAIRAYDLANEERLAEAALPALAIVLTGIIPVIILNRSITEARPGHGG